MPVIVIFKDSNSGRKGRINEAGEIVTGPSSPSTPTSVKKITVINTAVNLQVPLVNKEYRITSMFISSDKSVNINGAIVKIYEADEEDSRVATKDLLEINLQRQDKMPATGLNMIISEGAYLNAESDETTITITIAGYYVDIN